MGIYHPSVSNFQTLPLVLVVNPTRHGSIRDTYIHIRTCHQSRSMVIESMMDLGE